VQPSWDIKVGYRNKVYDGYRPLTAAEWQHPAIGVEILTCHAQHGGFPLFEAPMDCVAALHVHEGFALHAKQWCVCEGFDQPGAARMGRQVMEVFAVQNRQSKQAWTHTLPDMTSWATDASVITAADGPEPCLFVSVCERTSLCSRGRCTGLVRVCYGVCVDLL
jgi:hypothetical protein